jgi:hypothetical protein
MRLSFLSSWEFLWNQLRICQQVEIQFKWVLLRKTPEWKEIQDSLKEELITRTETEETRVFDLWTLIKSMRCWKTKICCIGVLHLRNIHGTIVVKYSPPHSLHKFLYGFRYWRIMVSSICLCNKTFFIILLFHEYRILHNPVPFLSQGNMVGLGLS